MVNVKLLCTKCDYEFTANIQSIDSFERGLPGTCPSCPRCRRKKWLRLVPEGGDGWITFWDGDVKG